VLFAPLFDAFPLISTCVNRSTRRCNTYSSSLLIPRHFACGKAAHIKSSLTSNHIQTCGNRQTMKRAYPFVLALSSGGSSSSSTTSISEKSNSSTASKEEEEQLQLYKQYCDPNTGLMTYTALLSIPQLAQWLQEKELLEEELLAMWEEVITQELAPNSKSSSIDYPTFQKLYQKINDLFEDVEEDDEGMKANGDSEQLLNTFKALSDGNDYITKSKLRQWGEITQLIKDGLLSDAEFETLYERSISDESSAINRSSSTSKKMDTLSLKEFLTFNEELDRLFVWEDDEDGEQVEMSALQSIIGSNLFSGGKDVTAQKLYDLTPQQLFSRLAAGNGKDIGFEDLKRWGELQDVIKSGDLLHPELVNIYAGIADAGGRLDSNGFLKLHKAIDDLFEEVEEDEVFANSEEANESFLQAAKSGSLNIQNQQQQQQQQQQQRDAQKKAAEESKNRLLQLLTQDDKNPQSLPCGLTADETLIRRIADAVTDLEKQSYLNRVLSSPSSSRGVEAISPEELAGSWELLYTSSAMMKFNKGLSGLGSTLGKFHGLVQNLRASKYLSDVEYVERIQTTAEAASFDVTITGDWKLKRSVSLLTGDPTIQLVVEPDRVNYGPTSTRADHWKSVRSMNLLDVTYLDNDLRLMRGNTSTETIFIFQRI